MNVELRMTEDEFFERAYDLLMEYVPYIKESPEKMERCGVYLQIADAVTFGYDRISSLTHAIDLSGFAWTRFGIRKHTKEECITALLINRYIRENTFCELFMTEYCMLDDDSIEEALFITSGLFTFKRWTDTYVREICDIYIKYGPDVPLSDIFQKEFHNLNEDVFNSIEKLVVSRASLRYNRVMLQNSLDWTCLNRTLHPGLTNDFIIRYKKMYDAARMLSVEENDLKKSMEDKNSNQFYI